MIQRMDKDKGFFSSTCSDIIYVERYLEVSNLTIGEFTKHVYGYNYIKDCGQSIFVSTEHLISYTIWQGFETYTNILFKVYCCLQGQLCDLSLWLLPNGKMIGILRITSWHDIHIMTWWHVFSVHKMTSNWHTKLAMHFRCFLTALFHQ